MLSPLAVEPATAASSPLALGRVFEANRSALVRVRSGKTPKWRQGFLVGAKGELVFDATKAPGPVLLVELSTGEQRPGRLLGFDRELGLAVGRIDGDGLPKVLSVAENSSLRPRQWLMVMSQRGDGRAIPHAGVLERAGKRLRLEAPGTPGAPILSIKGQVVAIARDRHRRRTRVWRTQRWVPFVKEVVRRADAPRP